MIIHLYCYAKLAFLTELRKHLVIFRAVRKELSWSNDYGLPLTTFPLWVMVTVARLAGMTINDGRRHKLNTPVIRDIHHGWISGGRANVVQRHPHRVQREDVSVIKDHKL